MIENSTEKINSVTEKINSVTEKINSVTEKIIIPPKRYRIDNFIYQKDTEKIISQI